MPSALRIAAERLTARAAVGLPRPVQRLAFGAGIRRDGLVLAPEVQTLVKLDQLVGAGGVDAVPLPEARARLRHDALVAGGRPRAMAEVRAVDAGGVPARLYVPPEAPTPSPLALWYHGGGHVVGDLDTHDPTCRWFAREAGVRVLRGRLPARARASLPGGGRRCGSGLPLRGRQRGRARRGPGAHRRGRRQRRRQPGRGGGAPGGR